jgi:hypothetical protein
VVSSYSETTSSSEGKHATRSTANHTLVTRYLNSVFGLITNPPWISYAVTKVFMKSSTNKMSMTQFNTIIGALSDSKNAILKGTKIVE